MDIHSLLAQDDDNYDHMDSNDHWFSATGQSTRAAYQQRMRSWILRILLGDGGTPAYRSRGTALYKSLAVLLDVPELANEEMAGEAIAKCLQKRAKEFFAPLAASGETNWPVLPCSMSTALAWFGESAGLNPVELAIFELAVALRVFQPLKLAAKTWGVINPGDLPSAVSAILNIPIADVNAALHSKGVLLSSGIVRIYPGSEERLTTLLLVTRHLSEGIAYHQGPPHEVLAHMAVPLRSGEQSVGQGQVLSLEDFSYIPQHTALARSWMEGSFKAAADGKPAGHMLVTGAPGLGKTQWCKALLFASDAQAFEMVSIDSRGGAISGEDRMMHLRMVMQMQRSTKRGIILFDEADDVFRGEGHREPLSTYVFGRNGRNGPNADAVSMENHRAAMNQFVENSRIPVIWIMNRPEVLDPAVLRRFDVEIHFEGIPRSVRLALIQKGMALKPAEEGQDLGQDQDSLPGFAAPGIAIPQAELQRWADVATLTPALIDRLTQVHARGRDAGVPLDAVLCRHWLRQRLPGRATQHLRIPMDTGGTDASAWSADQVNANVDLMELVAGIQRVGSARLAFCGIPGTGKTAFAHALARMLDKPLLEKRASDLLSAYVGETEQRISAAFEEAARDDAVLFIDEVDGLLANRDFAERNWEITQVNELLEQLGEYPGVVVIATNRIQVLDPAVLRRIDMQITFDALRPDQVRDGFAALCKVHAIELEPDQLDRASQLSGVTPGDFAALSRRLRFAPDARTASALIALLQEMLDRKAPVRTPVGFTHSGI